CQGGELHEDPEARGSRRHRLSRCRAGAPADRDLHRRGLQPPAAAFGPRLPVAGRVRSNTDGNAAGGTARRVPAEPELSLISVPHTKGAVQAWWRDGFPLSRE